jgi:hypothetical protein
MFLSSFYDRMKDKIPFFRLKFSPEGVKIASNARYPKPFQGEKECERRKRQLAASKLKFK